MPRSVIRRYPQGRGEIELRTERTDTGVQRERFGVTAEVSGDLGLAVAPGIHTDADTRRPVVGESIASVYAFHLLLFPAQAAVDGHVLAGTPRILREDRVVAGGRLEVQVSKFPTSLEQESAYAAIRTIAEARDI